MRKIGLIIMLVGAGIFVVDFAAVTLGGGDPSKAIFLGTNGFLSGIQDSLPIPIDLGLIAAGGVLFVL